MKFTKEHNFISYEHQFIDKNNSKYPDITVALNKGKFDDGEEYFGMTVYGEWDGKNEQIDLDFKNKKEFVKFVKGLIKVVKSDYQKEPNNVQ